MDEKIRRRERLDRGIKVRTEGIYAISSWRGIAYTSLPTAAFVLGLLIIPLAVTSMTWQKIIIIACVFAFLALSFDFLAHFVGIVCLGGAFFTGVGGYISGVLNSAFGVPLVITIPIATIGGAVICTLFLLPCLPMRGIYFAIVSLMYPLLFARVIQALDIFGGTDGLPGLATFPNTWVELYLILPMILILTFGLRRLVNEDFGIVLRAIKDNDQAVRASNINITWYKMKAVFLGSAIGCFAGAYLAHLYGWVGISLFALDFSIFPIAATVVGGVGTLVGPVIGAIILTMFSEMLREFGPLRVVFYSLILAGLVILNTGGLVPYLQRKYYQFEHWIEI
ncbi:MAG: branched-chain amino acid ABC transporter permease [Deltaproteobacteria bacterium CG03_land_8_20_14_0_80_45_14]|nr:MAG: branched-chain amino acid ABC transporter permease [Deltaproteobacteria bacterium CG03_land_8_20_14_0_80_45_14]